MTQLDDDDIGTVEDVVVYRLQTANEFIKAAILLLKNGYLKTAANRAYYAIFKTISALHALDGNHYRKHKAVLEHFNKNYIRTNIFPRDYGKKIYKAQELRHSSDYDDFKTPTEAELTEHIQFATKLMYDVRKYCQNRMKKSIVLMPEQQENEEERSSPR